MKYLLQLIAATLYLMLGKFYVDEHLRPHFIAEGIFLIVTMFVVDLGYSVYANWDRLDLVIRCWFHRWRKNSYIRFSMSYQYRIKIKDKYLLVKNSNWPVYQHVGGKYKRLPLTQKVLQDLEATDDLKLPTHGLTKDDLAVFIPAKNAIKFVDWFNERKEREISHWREFYEELIDGKAKVLTQANFPYVNYNYVKSVRTPLKKAEAPGWNCWEILQYDVLDIIPSASQEEELEKLLAAGDTDYIKWADNELINNLGRNNHERRTNYEIAAHAKWVVNLKWNKE